MSRTLVKVGPCWMIGARSGAATSVTVSGRPGNRKCPPVGATGGDGRRRRRHATFPLPLIVAAIGSSLPSHRPRSALPSFSPELTNRRRPRRWPRLPGDDQHLHPAFQAARWRSPQARSRSSSALFVPWGSDRFTLGRGKSLGRQGDQALMEHGRSSYPGVRTRRSAVRRVTAQFGQTSEPQSPIAAAAGLRPGHGVRRRPGPDSIRWSGAGADQGFRQVLRAQSVRDDFQQWRGRVGDRGGRQAREPGLESIRSKPASTPLTQAVLTGGLDRGDLVVAALERSASPARRPPSRYRPIRGAEVGSGDRTGSPSRQSRSGPRCREPGGRMGSGAEGSGPESADASGQVGHGPVPRAAGSRPRDPGPGHRPATRGLWKVRQRSAQPSATSVASIYRRRRR